MEGCLWSAKHKIWLAVLLVLLIAAIAAVVYLNSERAASDAQLASASAQLEEERGKYLTLEESLAEATAQSEQLTADKEALEAELSTVEASSDGGAGRAGRGADAAFRPRRGTGGASDRP